MTSWKESVSAVSFDVYDIWHQSSKGQHERNPSLISFFDVKSQKSRNVFSKQWLTQMQCILQIWHQSSSWQHQKSLSLTSALMFYSCLCGKSMMCDIIVVWPLKETIVEICKIKKKTCKNCLPCPLKTEIDIKVSHPWSSPLMFDIRLLIDTFKGICLLFLLWG